MASIPAQLPVEDGAAEPSGSSSISSPPVSPRHPSATPAVPPTAAVAPAEKPKRQRKKKEVGPDGMPIDDGKPKEKKPRKPREPKVTTNGSATPTTAASRKKIKVEEKPPTTANVTRKANIMDLLGKNAPPTASSPFPNLSSLQPPPAIASPRPVPPTTQRYDPVRAAMMDAAGFGSPSHVPTAHYVPSTNRASASPSIASLIDPPARSTVTTSSILRSPQSTNLKHSLIHSSPPQPIAFPTYTTLPEASPSAPRNASTDAMDIDTAAIPFKTLTKEDAMAEVKASISKPSSTAPTPKPTTNPRSSPPAPKGSGSGLLSTSDLTGDASSNGALKRKGVNIDIHITLDPAGSNHVNVAQEIVKKYGRDALNPRAAAHREQLLQVMSAGKSLGAMSADDVSLDLDSEADDDSNVEMGGMDDTGDGEKSRKRRKKAEEYDLDDEFIDDTELAWQQEAAVAKDGFFVYSGPLITEADSRADTAAASARGGRGRGRGRGRGAAASSSHASFAEKKETMAPSTSPASGRGRGRGRGTGATRKPRITKADKERLEAEKLSRERAVVNMSPGATAPLASSTSTAQHNGMTVV